MNQIHVDETDPVGDVAPAFTYREVEIQRGVDPKQLYELSSELGRGKFGVVYKCKEKSTGVRLAAKFIQIVKKGDRRNIEREVHMMNVLQHAKIAQLYAAYEFDRTFCVMMELVEGGELFDRVLDEKFVLTERACSIFMRQICDAVAYIHGNNIIHLDMKPENILCLTEAGNRIKIIDFGLAREYDPDNKLQVLFGTPEFVAPEVVNFEAISFATDMWSVGVIAYVLVSGLSPFAGEDDIQTMGNITIGRYDFYDEAFDDVSEEAIDFINRCLVKDQKERITAEDALRHKWIKRKPQYSPTNRRPEITNFKPILLETNNNSSNVTNNEIDKENLKELVGKWNETPNNRYAFDQDTENIISPNGESVQLRRPTLPEVSGLTNSSGSRRGSIARGAATNGWDGHDDGNDDDAENEAPNGGEVIRKAATTTMTTTYCDDILLQQEKQPHISLLLQPESKEKEPKPVAANGFAPCTNNHQAGEPASFDSCQTSVTRNDARISACGFEREVCGVASACANGGSDNSSEERCASGVDANNRSAPVFASDGRRDSSSSSICSSDSKASISSLSDGAPADGARIVAQSGTLTNTLSTAAAHPGLDPGSPLSPLRPCTPTDTRDRVRPRTPPSSGFCLSADGDVGGDTESGTAATAKASELPQEPTDPHHHHHQAHQVRDDLRKLSDLLKLSLTNVKDLDGGREHPAADARLAAPEGADAEGGGAASSSASISSSCASTVELDSELESLKSKVHTLIRTSRAQNKLNELAQRPDFLANETFKLPTFRFLPKSISLCNDDSVFKENYTKFCDRNASPGGPKESQQPTQEESSTEKRESPETKKTSTVVRKKSSTSGGTLKKKKDSLESPSAASTASSVTTTTTFSSTATGKIASTTTTTVRKTIVKQQKVVADESSSTTTTTSAARSRKSTLAPTKSLDSSALAAADSKVPPLAPSASIKRTKFRVNQMSSRDVPVAPLNSTVARRFLERSGMLGTTTTMTTTTTVDQTELGVGGADRVLGKVLRASTPACSLASADDTVTANNLRNSALKLRSLSVDWDGVDVAVENRSMKTINSILKRHAVASSAVRQIQAQLEATITTHK